MAQFSHQWPAGSLQNLHSSNPQPFDWQELEALIDTDLSDQLNSTPLAYESTQGDKTLRELISHQYYSDRSPDEIAMTSGAQEGLFLVMNALLTTGDHAITFTPCFEPLVTVAKNTGAEVTTLSLLADQNWSINWQQLENSFRNNTRLLIINFPHNPTGCHINQAELQRLIQLCEQHNCWLLSDEVFRGLEHQPEDRLPAASDLYPKAISLGVMSKAHALPGIRLGWLCTQNMVLIQKLLTIKSHLSICQSSLDAHICKAIIPHSQKIWQRNLAIIKQNKTQLQSSIKNHPTFHWQKPKASATCFIQLKNQSAMAFTTRMADEHQWLLMPNDMFLSQHQGFRLSLGIKPTSFDLIKLIKL